MSNLSVNNFVNFIQTVGMAPIFGILGNFREKYFDILVDDIIF